MYRKRNLKKKSREKWKWKWKHLKRQVIMTKKATATTNIYYVHKYNKNNYKCNSTGQQKEVES